MRNIRVLLSSLLLLTTALFSSFRADATVLTYFQTFTNVNYSSCGVGGLREVGYGTLHLTNVPAGSVQHAYLYWFGFGGGVDLGYEETGGNTNGTIWMSSETGDTNLYSYTFVNDPDSSFHYISALPLGATITNYQVTGDCIGISGVDSWGSAPFNFIFSQAYRADVTDLVNGGGDYVISYADPFGSGDGGFGTGAGLEGASLVVIYNDPANTNKNDIVIENGCDENSANAYDPLGWSVTIPGVSYSTGDGIDLEFHVGDGQLQYLETAVYLNGQVLAPSNPVVSLSTGQLIGQIFWGASPYDESSGFRYSFFTGSLWDINNYNIVPFLTPGLNNLTITTGFEDDDLTLVALIAKLKPGAAAYVNSTAAGGGSGILPPAANPVVVSTPVNTPVTINVLSGDYDQNSPALPIASTGNGTTPNGIIVSTSELLGGLGNPVPVLVFTPNLGFTGIATFPYTIANSAGLTATSTVTVVVTPVSQPPVAGPVTATTFEGVPVSINVMTNVSDPNKPAQTVSLTTASQPAGGTVSMVGNIIVFTPYGGYFGVTTFTYSVANASGLTASATVTVAVIGPPLANPDAATTTENTPVVINSLANDTDQNSPMLPILISGFNQPTGQGVVSYSGTNLLFKPATGFTGTVSFQYTITNSAGLSSTSIVTVVVTPPPLPPVAVADSASTQGGVPVSISVLANDYDQNSPALPIAISSYTQPAVASEGTVTLSGTNLVFSPNSSFAGAATFNYTITNTLGLASTTTVTVLVTSLPTVVLNLTAPPTVVCDGTISYVYAVTNTDSVSVNLTVVDPLLGGTIFSKTNVAAGVGFVFTNTYATSLSSGFVTNTASAIVVQANGLSATNTQTAITAITTAGVTSQIYGSFNSCNPNNGCVWFNAHIAATPGQNCAIYYQNASITLNCSNGKSYTYPVPNGKIIFNQTNTTGNCLYDGTNWNTFAPSYGDSQIFLSGCAIPWQSAFANCQSVSWTGTFCSDTPGVSCSWQWGSSCYNTNLTNYNGFGVKACYQTACGYGGSYGNGWGNYGNWGGWGNYQGYYSSADCAGTPENCKPNCQAGGCGYGGNNYCGNWTGSGYCSFSACPVAPVATPNSASTAENSAVTISVLGNDYDPNRPALPIAISSFAQPTNGTVTQSGGNLVFTPKSGFVGTSVFAYSITNSAGLSASSTVTVTVTPLPPVANPVTVTTQEGAPPVTINVLSHDSDGNSPALKIGIATFSQPSGGTGSVVRSGTNLVFTATGGFSGTVIFQYSITNTAGLSASSTVTVVVQPPPAVSLTLSGPTCAPIGSVITYTFAVTNVGQSAENLTVVDALLGGTIFTKTNVASGQGYTFAYNYTVGSNVCQLTNVASAIGSVASGASATNTASVVTAVTTKGTTNTICGNFNSCNPYGGYLWCNAHLSANPGKSCTVYCQNATITITGASGKVYNYPVPNCQVEYTNCSSGSAYYTGSGWSTTIPSAGDSQAFLCGTGIPWNSDFANCKSVCWTGTFSCSTTNVNCAWQWGAACYNQNLSNCGSVSVKACQQNYCGYNNNDCAGTPENCKSGCQGGGCGYGGNNYCGSFSSSSSFTCK